MDKLSRSLMRYMSAYSIMDLRRINAIPINGSRLSYRDVMILNIINEYGRCTVSGLAELTNVTKPTITVRIKGLEEKGFVRRTRSDTDHRVIYIELTDEMSECYRMDSEYFQRISAMIEDRFGVEGLSAFSEMLDVTSDHMIGKEGWLTDDGVR